MEDLISVIVITYNEEKTIARTLDSILMQKCSLPIEIVIGEDNSTDGTRAVCEDYARRFPSIIRLMDKAPNKGLVDNFFDANCLTKTLMYHSFIPIGDITTRKLMPRLHTNRNPLPIRLQTAK